MVSDDEEEAGTPSKRTTEEDSFDFGSEKKSKKKKKSTSKSKSSSSSIPPSSSAPSSSSATAAYSKASQLLTGLTSGLRSNRLASSTSPKSLLSRVLILVVFSLVLIGSFVYYQQVLEAEELRLLEEARVRAQSRKSVVDDEVIEQKMGKEVPKFSLQKEREFGCKEVSCISECNGKAKPKCLKSKSCVAERYHICHKRCRKTRCEERCKNEPKMGYVEKEQGLDNCKEACTGPTATHNKCIVKCHVKFKPCKTKCYETANKFKCDNPKILALLEAKPLEDKSSAKSGGGGEEENEEDGGGDGGGGEEDEEEEDAPKPPPKTSAKSKPALAGLGDDDLL